eukprot:1138441-Rhodomonas_salina.4
MRVEAVGVSADDQRALGRPPLQEDARKVTSLPVGPAVKGQGSRVKGQESGVRGQGSAVSGQRSAVSAPKSTTLWHIPRLVVAKHPHTCACSSRLVLTASDPTQESDAGQRGREEARSVDGAPAHARHSPPLGSGNAAGCQSSRRGPDPPGFPAPRDI